MINSDTLSLRILLLGRRDSGCIFVLRHESTIHRTSFWLSAGQTPNWYLASRRDIRLRCTRPSAFGINRALSQHSSSSIPTVMSLHNPRPFLQISHVRRARGVWFSPQVVLWTELDIGHTIYTTSRNRCPLRSRSCSASTSNQGVNSHHSRHHLPAPADI